MFIVSQQRKQFAPEDRREAANLVIESQRPIVHVAKEIGVYLTGVRSPGLSSTAPANVPARRPCVTRPKRRLILSESAGETREVSKLREERDILRKAAKFFAEETRW